MVSDSDFMDVMDSLKQVKVNTTSGSDDIVYRYFDSNVLLNGTSYYFIHEDANWIAIPVINSTNSNLSRPRNNSTGMDPEDQDTGISADRDVTGYNVTRILSTTGLNSSTPGTLLPSTYYYVDAEPFRISSKLRREFYPVFNGFSFKCNGKDYDYTTESLVDPDISGIGVTISFLITSIVVLILLLYGFRRHLIVDEYPNPIDNAVYRWLVSSKAPTGAKRAREKRAFHVLISALSDQQLMIGLATLIAGVSYCELSVYGLRNLVAVAWLTVFGHISTLVVTTQNVNTYANKPARIVRGVAMVAMLILLTYCTAAYIYVNGKAPSLQMKVLDYTHAAGGAENGTTLRFLTVPKAGLEDVFKGSIQSGFTMRYIFTLPNSALEFSSFLKIYGYLYLHFVVDNFVSGLAVYFYALWICRFLGFQLNLRLRLREYIFRRRARSCGIEIQDSFNYRVYRQLRNSLRWERIQRDGFMMQLAGRDDGSKLARTAYDFARFYYHQSLFFLWLPAPKTRSILYDLLILNGIVVQALTRFGSCWAGFSDLQNSETLQDASGAKRDILNWGLGQIMAVILLTTPTLAWIQAYYDPLDPFDLAPARDRDPEVQFTTNTSDRDSEADKSTKPQAASADHFSANLNHITATSSTTPVRADPQEPNISPVQQDLDRSESSYSAGESPANISNSEKETAPAAVTDSSDLGESTSSGAWHNIGSGCTSLSMRNITNPSIRTPDPPAAAAEMPVLSTSTISSPNLVALPDHSSVTNDWIDSELVETVTAETESLNDILDKRYTLSNFYKTGFYLRKIIHRIYFYLFCTYFLLFAQIFKTIESKMEGKLTLAEIKSYFNFDDSLNRDETSSGNTLEQFFDFEIVTSTADAFYTIFTIMMGCYISWKIIRFLIHLGDDNWSLKTKLEEDNPAPGLRTANRVLVRAIGIHPKILEKGRTKSDPTRMIELLNEIESERHSRAVRQIEAAEQEQERTKRIVTKWIQIAKLAEEKRQTEAAAELRAIVGDDSAGLELDAVGVGAGGVGSGASDGMPDGRATGLFSGSLAGGSGDPSTAQRASRDDTTSTGGVEGSTGEKTDAEDSSEVSKGLGGSAVEIEDAASALADTPNKMNKQP